MKLHVSVYFAKHLQAKPMKRSTDNRRVKPATYGEVMTSDEVIERLEEKEKEKARKEKEKADKAAERAEKAKKKDGKKKGKKTKPAQIEQAQDSDEEIGKLD